MKDYLKPKTIWFTYTKGFIGEGIRKSQDIYWKEFRKKSQFSHVVLVGSNGMVYESTAELKWVKVEKKFFKWTIKIPTLKFVNGVKKSTMDKYYSKYLKKANLVGVQYNFSTLTDNDWDEITDKAEELLKSKINYGFRELAGTFKVLIKWKWLRLRKKYKKADELIKKENPFDEDDAMYCIAYVEECMEEVCTYCDPNWHNSLLTVDHGWQSTNIKYKKKKFKN